MKAMFADRANLALLAVALLGLLSGLGFMAAGRPDAAALAFGGGVIPVLAALLVEILRSLARREVGLDIVAALSMSAALIFDETLAAAVVALMYSGGTFLESFAAGRARREMTDLLSRVPRTATLHQGDTLTEVALDRILPGDLLLIRQGAVAPVDGTVAGPGALLDQSALTGESMPVRRMQGQDVMSGSTNAGDAFDLRATHRAADSTYAGIVRLVETAQASKAPMARMADRYAMLFLAVTVTLATAAWWVTGDPIRAVAVLVVATPCPLILAVPVALVAGLSRAAHYGVLIKGAKPLEALAGIRTLILDKTGTLTQGRPQIVSVQPTGSLLTRDQVIRYAAALDQASGHPIAQAIVASAQGTALPVPTAVVETPGEGVAGIVEGHAVVVGGTDFVMAQLGLTRTDAPLRDEGAVVVSLGVDGAWRGIWSWRTPAAGHGGVAGRAASPRHRAHSAGHGRPARGRDGGHAGAWAGRCAGRSDPGRKGPAGPVRTRRRSRDDGGRRGERRTCACRRRHRRRDGCARGRRIGRGRGCRPAGRPAGQPAARHRDRATRPSDRPAKRRGRDRPVGAGHDRRGIRLSVARPRRDPAGGDRRRRDPECPACPADRAAATRHGPRCA